MGDDRLLVIGLDGFDITIGDQFIAGGHLPALRALRDRSARFLLDHGTATRTGLAWEHFASGLTPKAGERAAPITFDPSTYEVVQEGARFEPFLGRLDTSSVVFDAPYTDLARAPQVRGVVGWGAHDSGINTAARPSELIEELASYPAREWIYATPWPSAEATKAMGAALVQGVRARRLAASSLLTERLDDWEIAVVVAGEPHSAAEAFWHGVDANHPLHDHPSAEPAAAALLDVYRQVDRLVSELIEATHPDRIVVFSMGGMGPNHSDVASMVLLPELLFRWAGHAPLLEVPVEWSVSPQKVPLLPPDTTWPDARPTSSPPASTLESLVRALPEPIKQPLRPVKRALKTRRRLPALTPTTEFRRRLDWQPATRYREWWPQMRAFGLPSYYDGRVRVNLRGREVNGLVEPSEYETVRDEIEQLVRACRDPRTGEPVVENVERPRHRDPASFNGTDADLLFVWRSGACAFVHPIHGLIGPVPYRRTGGHTGPHGFAYVTAPGLSPKDHGMRSVFDVAPTIVELAGQVAPEGMCGRSLLAEKERL